MFVLEGTTLKNQKNHSVNLTIHDQEARETLKWKAKKGMKQGLHKLNEPSKASQFNKEHKDKCHLCNKVGHFQKDCLKRKIWYEKKGKLVLLYVSNKI